MILDTEVAEFYFPKLPPAYLLGNGYLTTISPLGNAQLFHRNTPIQGNTLKNLRETRNRVSRNVEPELFYLVVEGRGVAGAVRGRAAGAPGAPAEGADGGGAATPEEAL